ncbi:hypothetical protein NE237_017158 [Protea cynaroides]|uniref:Acetylajmalan esterase-like n=1 Tax=Protea cynaroides TaxID=273540 RepID=A0A9Q0QMU3_9MAGN|nr:hypothetical protein NE237_017158 [Protea cynaroides]
MADTGNLIIDDVNSTFARPPYGMTYFGKPTGRCSDGLIMIDYFALALGLPFLNPYLKKGANFTAGVNFAVTGATALNTSFLIKEKIPLSFTNNSLSVQLEWFRTHLQTICFTQTECKQKLKNALFFVGEIGVNDYFAFSRGGKTMKEIQNLVPLVVQMTKNAVREVIELGATRLIVPGCFPLGCTPVFLTLFKSNDSTSYDTDKCLKDYNKFIRIHNMLLQQELQELKKEYTDVDIVYADYNAAYTWVLTHGSSLGFEVGSILKACCGVGGDYNFDLAKMCGIEGVPACSDPKKRMIWDGFHLTMKGNELMADWILNNTISKIQC